MNLGVKITAGVVLAAALTGSYWVTSMVINRSPPIVYEQARVLSATVPQGGTIDVEFKVLRNRLCPGTTSRWLIDSVGEKHSIPSFTIGVADGIGRQVYQRSITIPDAAAIGPAQYLVETAYTCSLVDRLGFPIHVVSPPITFDITPAAD